MESPLPFEEGNTKEFKEFLRLSVNSPRISQQIGNMLGKVGQSIMNLNIDMDDIATKASKNEILSSSIYTESILSLLL